MQHPNKRGRTLGFLVTRAEKAMKQNVQHTDETKFFTSDDETELFEK